MKKKIAVLDYPDSDNLGDFIQSIATARLLQNKPLYLDRDELHLGTTKPTKLILNGWFMEKPEHWPPGPGIEPLFVSFHMNPTAQQQMLSPEGIAYLKKYAPIGCRDKYTLNLMQKHQIPAYFSACLTLSLSKSGLARPADAPKTDYLLLCSALERLNPRHNPSSKGLLGLANQLKNIQRSFLFRRATKRLDNFLAKSSLALVRRSQLASPKTYKRDERFALAEDQLCWIAHASLVVTSRIHTALPAAAMGVPVLFLSDGLEHPNQQSRLSGLQDFFCTKTTKQLASLEVSSIEKTQAIAPYVEDLKIKISEFLKK